MRRKTDHRTTPNGMRKQVKSARDFQTPQCEYAPRTATANGKNTRCHHQCLHEVMLVLFIGMRTICVRRAGHLSNDKERGAIRRRLHAVVMLSHSCPLP